MDDKDKIEGHEYNLKLYNESIRKDLDIILTSTIPIQKNLMKTILWINTSIIGLVLLSFRESFTGFIIIMPFIFSLASILTILISLKNGRVKSFGSPELLELQDIKVDKWMKYQGLLNLSKSYKIALDTNAKIIKNRGKKIALSINLTIFSIVCLAVIATIQVSSNLNVKEESVSNEDNQSIDDTRPTKASSTSKPSVSLATNNTNRNSESYAGKVSIAKSKSTPKKQEKNSEDKK